MQQRAIESDAKMVEQAILLLCEGGVKAVTLEAVGQRAGYSRGLVTRRYGSKNQLLIRVLKYLENWCLDNMRSVNNQKKGLETLHFLVKNTISRIKTHPENYRAMFILWAYALESDSIVKEEFLQLSKKMREQHRIWLLQAQELGEIPTTIDLELIIDFIIQQSIGIFNQWLLEPDFKIEDQLQRMIAVQVFLVSQYAGFREDKMSSGGYDAD